MTETAQLIATIKKQLKRQGLTYGDVAVALRLSEPSVKRLFSSGSFTLERLIQVGNLLGFSLAELAQEAAANAPRLMMLTEQDEQDLASDTKLLLVAVCALNHWAMGEIVSVYRLTEAECIKRLLQLDRMRIIDLRPGNQIRVVVSRDFDWQPNGSIRKLFRNEGRGDFLSANFSAPAETMAFVQGMVTEAGALQLQSELRKLRQKLAELHQDALAVPLSKRRGTGLLFALREWEPAAFTKLRRAARDVRDGGKPQPGN